MTTTDSATPDDPEALLARVPFFSRLERVELARLVGAVEPLRLLAGSRIFAEGAAADALYLLAEGRVSVTVRAPDGEHTLVELAAPTHLGELGLLLERRTASATALTDVVLWRLPRERFEAVLREQQSIGIAVAASLAVLLDQRSRERAGAPVARPRGDQQYLAARPALRPRLVRLLGLVLALGVPAVLWKLSPPTGLSERGWHVLAIVAGAALGWLFEPVPDFVVTVAMAAAWGITGLVPARVAFAGFLSSSWIVAVGAFALAAAMVRSGLLLRIGLKLLRAFPAGHAGQVLGLVFGGALVTPVLPLGLARVATAMSLAVELSHALGCAARSRASAALGFAALIGYGSFSAIALTGLAMNFLVVDLLPPAERARAGWQAWLLAAAPAGAVLGLGSTAALLLLFRPEHTVRARPEQVQRQQRVLGGVSRRELATVSAAGVFVLGLVAQPVLHVDAAWLSMGSVVVLFAGGALDRSDFRGSIDWGFLMLFGILLGLAGVLREGAVDVWIAAQLAPLARLGDPAITAVALALVVVLVRLVLPWVATTLLLAVALVPVAGQLGLSAWVVGFIVLLTAQTWIVPGLYEPYVLARASTRGELFTDRQALVMGVTMTAVTLAAVAVSVVVWRAGGTLTR